MAAARKLEHHLRKDQGACQIWARSRVLSCVNTETVKLYGHGQGFDQCPGARKWTRARIETRNAREARPEMAPLLKPLAQCPECGKWLNFNKKGTGQ